MVATAMPAATTKARHAADAHVLEDIPNIGRAVAGDLRRIGIERPQQLRGQDALGLYLTLNRATQQRHDPCMLDTFMAAVDFMNGAPAAPWWHYTAERKLRYRDI